MSGNQEEARAEARRVLAELVQAVRELGAERAEAERERLRRELDNARREAERGQLQLIDERDSASDAADRLAAWLVEVASLARAFARQGGGVGDQRPATQALLAAVHALDQAEFRPALPGETPGQVEPDDARPQPLDLPKPERAEAVRLTNDAGWEAIAARCGALLVNVEQGDSGEVETVMLVPTPDGQVEAREGDWVIWSGDEQHVAASGGQCAQCPGATGPEPVRYEPARRHCWGDHLWMHGHQCDAATFGTDDQPPTHCYACGGNVPADQWRRLYVRTNEEASALRPTIVCLCGSTRFSDAFQETNLRETMAGRIVLSIGCDLRSDHDLWSDKPEAEIEAIKARLDELHKRKIDLADEVLILNVGGYIGSSTRSELEYARRLGKRVRFLEPDTSEEATA